MDFIEIKKKTLSFECPSISTIITRAVFYLNNSYFSFISLIFKYLFLIILTFLKVKSHFCLTYLKLNIKDYYKKTINMSDIKKWEDLDHWVKINLTKCVGAGECVEVCPANVYELNYGQVIAENIGECIDCSACQFICPTDAILSHSAWD